MKPISIFLARIAVVFAGASWLAAAPAFAADEVTVSSCPALGRLPVSFRIDCSRVKDEATKLLCARFVENQACKLFPAYRRITDIKLEERCKSITYTIYEDDNWPYKGKGEGGLALKCAVDYLAEYSVRPTAPSKLGPYDAHEILHEYQGLLGALPSEHVLFGPSMAEAMRIIGDDVGYEKAVARMKEETQRFDEAFRKAATQKIAAGSTAGECRMAQTQIEATLYLENHDAVYAFYRKLVRGMARDQADRDARFNRMYELVSGGKGAGRKFLTEHGCAPF